MEFLKGIAGKIVAAVLGLAVVAGAISWWRMDEATRGAILSGTGRTVAWLGVVLFLPWATFFIVAWVGRMESNLAGGLLVAVYTALEFLLLMWLFGWSGHSAGGWTFIGFGMLVAAVYNLFTCDWIAEKVA